MRQINIDWQGPLLLNDVKQLRGPEDYGVYQIYGFHPVYGDNVLLYIGRAKDISFGARLQQHRADNWSSSVRVYVGRLCMFGELPLPDNEEWSREIEVAEKLLIFVHSPAWNSSNIQDTGSIVNFKEIHVMNWGSRGCLLPEITGIRWNAGGYNRPDNLKRYRLPEQG